MKFEEESAAFGHNNWSGLTKREYIFIEMVKGLISSGDLTYDKIIEDAGSMTNRVVNELRERSK